MPKALLTVDEILHWADAFLERRGRYPRQDDGPVFEADLTWSAVGQSLRRGYRGLPCGSSLAELLRTKRGVRNKKNPPKLTCTTILRWADRYHADTRDWPTHLSGPVTMAPGETWLAVDCALRMGGRGLPVGSSLAQLLEEARGVRNHLHLAKLTIEGILAWADAHRARTGHWPSQSSGADVGAEGETWYNLSMALLMGRRGLPPGGSLARLLAVQRGVRHPHEVAPLDEPTILRWAEVHQARHGHWPTGTGGPIDDVPGETWEAVESALGQGLRSLPGGDSLARLLARQRGRRNRADLPPLTLEQIAAWALAHFRRHRRWPTQNLGALADAPGETWSGIAHALRRSRRGLPTGQTLAQLCARLKNTGQSTE
jgi:hypothetical protein